MAEVAPVSGGAFADGMFGMFVPLLSTRNQSVRSCSQTRARLLCTKMGEYFYYGDGLSDRHRRFVVCEFMNIGGTNERDYQVRSIASKKIWPVAGLPGSGP